MRPRIRPLRRLDPHRLQRFQHPRWRRHLDLRRLARFQQALQPRQDRGPAGAAAGKDVVAERRSWRSLMVRRTASPACSIS